MKLRRFLAALLVFVLVLTGSPVAQIFAVEAEEQTEPPQEQTELPQEQTPGTDDATEPQEEAVVMPLSGELQAISAPDTTLVLRSAAVKYSGGVSFVERGDTTGIYGDQPRIDNLLDLAPGEFNKSGQAWPWIAVKVNVPAAGTYTLGVQTNSCKWANFKLPLVVNRQVYTLTYTAKAQQQTVSVWLPAGEQVVTVFWPMPANESEVYPGEDWNTYLWCNIQSLLVDGQLTVSLPAVAEVEDSLVDKSDKVISAADGSKVLWSATVAAKNEGGVDILGRNDQVVMNADQVTIETLFDDAPGQFNKSGEEWGWFAVKVTAPAAGTYTLSIQTQGSKYATYKLPLCVNGTVYPVSYTAKAQTASVSAYLTAGDNVVTVFMPMPETVAKLTNEAWNDYHWCNVQNIITPWNLTVSKPTAAEVEGCFPVREDSVVQANDTTLVLTSPAVADNGNGYLEFNQRDAVKADKPFVDTLVTKAPGQFNKAGQEWGWFAVKVTAPTPGRYNLGVNVQECRNAPFSIPLYVNGQVYTLSYPATKNQSAAVEVYLPAGSYTVVMFMPMPATSTAATGQDWVDYPWCNVRSLNLGYGLVASKPTVAEVESCFPKVDQIIAAIDNTLVLTSPAVADNGAGRLEFNQRDAVKADLPFIDSLYADATGEFNKSGEEGGWFAYKVSAPEAGTYKLGVIVQDCRNAPYIIPLCVNGQTYSLNYAATKAQTATAQVTLPAGESTVVMFMPMRQMQAGATGQDWVDYPWCNVQSVIADYDLTVSKPTVAEVEAVFAPKTLSSTNVSYMLLSKVLEANAGQEYLARSTDGARDDKPYIDSLYENAAGEFNVSGSEWAWFAYKVTVPAEGDYVLGVETAGCKYDAYKIPLCVNGTAYALSYSAKNQQQTAKVHLTAGSHTAVMFMPMPQNATGIQNNVWNDYPWCNIKSIIVNAGVTVSKPTVAEVESCFTIAEMASPLWNQSALFVGDSITRASFSWASVIGNAYKMAVTNAAVNGATVSDLGSKLIRHQLMVNAGNSYSYVILHGGINDAAGAQPGAVSASWNVADFDTATYAGALETMFYYAYENFGSAKLGYIINYATPNADTSKWKGAADTAAYFAVAKQVCDKWGISYIDLHSGTASDGRSYSLDILNIDADASVLVNGDAKEIHLSAEGYNRISPYIASWMETLTVKTSPVPAQNRGKHIDANDTDKVLSSNFTVKCAQTASEVTVGLQDRVYTGMVADQANIEYLPYAKDKLGSWAFGSIAVEAPEDGQYTFKVEIGAKTASHIGMLVDDQAYDLTYSKNGGNYQFLEKTVTLTKGKHYITFTAAMPTADNALDGAAWDIYPWTNIAAIVADEGLQVLAKPTLEEVTSKLQPYAPIYTRVEAEDAAFVRYNHYNTPKEKNDSASGGYVVGGAWNSVYKQTYTELESWMDTKDNAYVEYAVMAPADGDYTIRVGFLAGSNDKTVAKPFIAAVVNGKAYKVPFTKNWNQVDKAKVTVSLKKGLNIIRCTGITVDQPIYAVKGWVNHDFLDLDKRLTPVKHSVVTVEAENTLFFNKLKSQPGGKDEGASGYVLGSSDRRYVSGQWLDFETFETWQLPQLPYMCVTVTAPEDGYYPVSVYMGFDGRYPRGYIGMLMDGTLSAVPFHRTSKTTAGGRVDTLVYLTKGDHVLTFTTPMPLNNDTYVNYSYLWANFDYVTLHNGLTLAAKQVPPTYELPYVRVEVEDNAMFNLCGNNGTASGNAYYKTSQTIEQMQKDGIDAGLTPFVQLQVNADEAGDYLLYLGVTTGMTAGCKVDAVAARFVVEVNGEQQVKTVVASKTTFSTIVAVKVTLQEGKNILRLTHLNGGSQTGSGTTWLDFDYLEIPTWFAKHLEFVQTGNKLEAESSRYGGFAECTGGSYSNGRYLGRANYDSVAEANVSYDTLSYDNYAALPYVSYRVFAQEAGTYQIAIGFAAGLTNYPMEEYQQGIHAGFGVIVNGKDKQYVDFTLTSPSANLARMITVELQEGENEIIVTGSTSDLAVDRLPRVEETYRLVWIDQDYLAISPGLSNLGQGDGAYDVEDSGYDFDQLTPGEATEPAETLPGQPAAEPQTDLSVLIWVAAGVGAAMILLLILLIAKKRKKTD